MTPTPRCTFTIKRRCSARWQRRRSSTPSTSTSWGTMSGPEDPQTSIRPKTSEASSWIKLGSLSQTSKAEHPYSLRNLVAITKRVLRDLSKDTELLQRLIGSMPARLQAVAELRCAAKLYSQQSLLQCYVNLPIILAF